MFCLSAQFVLAQNFSEFFGNNSFEEAHAVIPTLDSAYMVAGLHETATGDTNIFLAKRAADGSEIWNQSYGTGFSENSEMLAITQLSDSSFVIAGTYQPIGVPKQALIFRVDKAGSVLWFKSHGCAGIAGASGSSFFGVKELSNGNILAYGNSACAHGGEDAMFRVYDLAGTVLTTQHLGSTDNESFYDAIETLDNGFLFVGRSTQFSTAIQGGAWAVKLDNNFNLEWYERYQASPHLSHYSHLVQMQDSSFWLMNSGRKTAGIAPFYRPAELLHFDKNGNFLAGRGIHGLNGDLRGIGMYKTNDNQLAVGVQNFQDSAINKTQAVVVLDTLFNVINSGLINEDQKNFSSNYSFNSFNIDLNGAYLFATNFTNSASLVDDMILAKRDSNVGSFCDGFPVNIFNAIATKESDASVCNVSTTPSESVPAGFTALPLAWANKGYDCYCGETAITPDTASVCENKSITFNLPGNDVQWSPNTEISCTNCANPTITPTASRWYYYAIDTAAASSSCAQFDSIFIEVEPAIDIFLGNDTTVCSEDSLVLYAGSFDSYLWQDGSTDSAYVIGVNDTTRWYHLTVSSGACTDTDSIFITVSNAPVFNHDDTLNICAGDTAYVDLEGGLTYNWTPNQDISCNTCQDPKLYPSTSMWYYVEVDKGGGCYRFDSIYVASFPDPAPDLGPNTGICPGDTIILDASAHPGPYLWQDGSTNPTYEVTGSGIYWVEVSNGLCAFRDSITIGGFAPADADLGGDTVKCVGDNMFLSPGAGFTSYTWHDGSTNPIYQVPNLADGQVLTVHVTVVSSGGCTGADTIQVTGSAKPTVSFDTTTYNICPNKELQIIPNVSDYDSIVWNDGTRGALLEPDEEMTYIVSVFKNGCVVTDSIFVFDLPFPFVDAGPDTAICKGDITGFFTDANAHTTWSTGAEQPYIFLSEPGIYWVGATNACGSFRDTLIISDLGCDCNVWAPNVFTPNGDLENDFFAPNVDCQLVDYKLEIFNRWGDPVFQTNNQSTNWNGNVNGTPAPEGVYFYVVYTESLSNREKLSGYVSLYR